MVHVSADLHPPVAVGGWERFPPLAQERQGVAPGMPAWMKPASGSLQGRKGEEAELKCTVKRLAARGAAMGPRPA